MNESVAPSETHNPAAALFQRLGLGGKLLGIGSALGVVACFLPFYSVSISSDAMGFSHSSSILLINIWQGVVTLLAYAGLITLTVLMFPPSGGIKRELSLASLCVAALVALLALWVLIMAFTYSSHSAGLGGSASAGPSIGAFLNLLTAGCAATGATMCWKRSR